VIQLNYLQTKLKVIDNNITTKQVIIITTIFILFTSFVLPFVSEFTTKIIGVSESPDTSFSFNTTHIIDLVSSYGKEGRRFYVIIRWTFDVIWPIIYTLFLASSIAYLSRRSNCKFEYKPLYFVLLGVIFDLLENINATIIMISYPKEAIFFIYLLLLSSILKWVFIGFSFIILIVLLIRFGIQSSKKTLVQ